MAQGLMHQLGYFSTNFAAFRIQPPRVLNTESSKDSETL
jgi:hypothetical protein